MIDTLLFILIFICALVFGCIFVIMFATAIMGLLGKLAIKTIGIAIRFCIAFVAATIVLLTFIFAGTII